MNKNINSIKKFQFFEPERFDPKQMTQEKQNLLRNQFKDYTLNDFTPVHMVVKNKFIFLAGQISGGPIPEIKRQFRLIKLQNNFIIDEYVLFSDSLITFDFLESGANIFLIALGTELRADQEKSSAKVNENCFDKKYFLDKDFYENKVIPTPNSILTLKIIDFTAFLNQTNAEKYQLLDSSIKLFHWNFT
jgi:hypothetical protein